MAVGVDEDVLHLPDVGHMREKEKNSCPPSIKRGLGGVSGLGDG